MLGMRKKNEKKSPHTRKSSNLNLNIINLFGIFLLTQKIKEKVVMKRLKPGIESKNFLEVINISPNKDTNSVILTPQVEYIGNHKIR
jgi:hypothetical protein